MKKTDHDENRIVIYVLSIGLVFLIITSLLALEVNLLTKIFYYLGTAFLIFMTIFFVWSAGFENVRNSRRLSYTTAALLACTFFAIVAMMVALDGTSYDDFNVNQLWVFWISAIISVVSGVLSIIAFIYVGSERHLQVLTPEQKPSDNNPNEKIQKKKWQPRPLQSLTPKQEEISTLLEEHGIITRSPAMINSLENIQKIAESGETILITGPTGVGKEPIVHALHKLSKRAHKQLVIINIGSVLKEHAQSVLFGHKKGSFTGAYTDKPGLFEDANTGNMFIDEIGKADLNVQTQLLRILETGKAKRMGENKDYEVDVRVIATANEVLEDAIKTGKFLNDLYYRLNILRLKIPPLSERPEDILALTKHFAKEYLNSDLDLPDSLFQPLLALPIEGNVRQLKNAIRSTIVNSESSSPEDLIYHITRKISDAPLDDEFEQLLRDLGDSAVDTVTKFHTSFNLSTTVELVNYKKDAISSHINTTYLIVGSAFDFDIEKIVMFFTRKDILSVEKIEDFKAEYAKRYRRYVITGEKIREGENPNFRGHESVIHLLPDLDPNLF